MNVLLFPDFDDSGFDYTGMGVCIFVFAFLIPPSLSQRGIREDEMEPGITDIGRRDSGQIDQTLADQAGNDKEWDTDLVERMDSIQRLVSRVQWEVRHIYIHH